MTYAQLGPPVAVAGRGGSTPIGGAGGDHASAARSGVDDGGFTAALESRRTPASSDARTAEPNTPKDAAGPRTGELHDEAAADAGASEETGSQTATGADDTAVADATAALAAAIATVVPAIVAPAPQATDALAAQGAVEVAQVAPPQPIAGLVPARLDGTGGVAPALTASPAAATAIAPAPVTAPATTAVPVPAAPVATTQAPVVAATANAAATVAPDTTATADAAVTAPAPVATPATPAATTAPAATLTLTIGTASSQNGSLGGGLEQDAQAQVPAGPVATPAPAADKSLPAPVRPQVQEAAPAAATSPQAPAGAVAPAPVQPLTHADPLGGIVRSGGGLTTPHELARELGTRVHMAVREGGRELVLNLRPADLGHLTIKVTMNEGVMQAQIIADRPEAARMLQQSMEHLDTALGDLGYSLDNLDVAYQGQDPRDAQAPAHRKADGAVSGEVLEADGSPAVPGSSTTSATGAPGRLDILA